MLKILIIILIILLIFILFLNLKLKEHLNVANGELSKDEQYRYDSMFKDVDHYPNIYTETPELDDPSKDLGKLKKLGLKDCREKCRGKCVEYGITGNAYCFNQI